MTVERQAPQPTIKCFHSVDGNNAVQSLYQEFTPSSSDISGKNLQSYNFERSLENFGGSFSFTVVEDIVSDNTFMDAVQPLDIIVISENGDNKVDFIGVVTTISIGGIASNLAKTVTVSGKSIEWLLCYLNIDCDIKCTIFNNRSANNIFITDLANNDGKEGISISDIVIASLKTFRTYVSVLKDEGSKEGSSLITNFLVGDIIDSWFGGEWKNWVEGDTEKFAYPISSNMFESGKTNVIDYIKKLLPQPVYEIFSYIDDSNNPKLMVRTVPFDNPSAAYSIRPELITDYTLTRNCEEVYTSFFAYIEGTKQSPDFYMGVATATDDKMKGYNFSQLNKDKAALYGYQLLTCSFVGYNAEKDAKSDTDKIQNLNENLAKWFSRLDEMYAGDITFVNLTNTKKAKIGEWVKFAGGLFYVNSERHSWTYGDNPMINYQVTRGGKYSNGNFTPLKNLSAIYKEFEE